MKLPSQLPIVVASLFLAAFSSGCHTAVSESQIARWERAGNVTRLSQAARRKSEPALIRKRSLESLARLNWKPTNDERLQVYSMFASSNGQQEAGSLMHTLSADQFAAIDQDVIACCSLLDRSGAWRNREQARPLFEKIRQLNSKAVTLSLCQQTVARPEARTSVLLLAIKLGIPGSEDDLNAVLLEYGDKSMAEDYLNSGSGQLHDGGARWANAHGYNVRTGDGSHRSGWGQF